MKKKTKKRCDYKRISTEHLALKKLRLDLGLTLKQVGELLGLSAKGLGAIENGRLSLDRTRILKIFKKYRLSEKEFNEVKIRIESDSKCKLKRVYSKRVLSIYLPYFLFSF